MRKLCRSYYAPKCLSVVKTFQKKTGFTVAEVLVALTILAVSLCGLLLTYLNMFVLADLTRDAASAESALRARVEEIKSVPFDNLTSESGPFNLTDYGFSSGLQSMGTVEVTSNFAGYNGTLTMIRAVATYVSRDRVIGEDVNFNGQLDEDEGEDTNGNHRLDSPVELITLIVK